MSGACFANVSDFSYWRDLAAFNRRCLAHVLQMFLIFLLEGLRRHCQIGDVAHVLQMFLIFPADLAACVQRCPARFVNVLIFPTGGTLAAFNPACPARVLQMFLDFSLLEDLTWHLMAISGACFADVS